MEGSVLGPGEHSAKKQKRHPFSSSHPREASLELWRPKLFQLEKQFLTSAAFLAGILVWRGILTKTFLLINVATHFQLLPVMFIEFGQNINKHHIS